MSSTQFWVGMLVPPIVKWASPKIKRVFKLQEFDSQTKERVTTKQYPACYAYLYVFWALCMVGSGLVVFFLILYFFPGLFPNKGYSTFIWVGLINMLGAMAIFRALIDLLFWSIASENFKDYVMFRQLKSGWGYDIKQQVLALLKIGFIYYIFALPLTLFLLV